ncbi:hypothetical protein RND81_02G204900 [Saponaria officinalis]|uniref:Uncharacterized protein n=1 Tax=Saponaria officinalis TaxID=3572 RepID=A0AAW1MWE4_SAPOF
MPTQIYEILSITNIMMEQCTKTNTHKTSKQNLLQKDHGQMYRWTKLPQKKNASAMNKTISQLSKLGVMITNHAYTKTTQLKSKPKQKQHSKASTNHHHQRCKY